MCLVFVSPVDIGAGVQQASSTRVHVTGDFVNMPMGSGWRARSALSLSYPGYAPVEWRTPAAYPDGMSYRTRWGRSHGQRCFVAFAGDFVNEAYGAIRFEILKLKYRRCVY